MTRDFEALVRTHQAAVCATAYSVLRDRARAEEVAQDAFLIAWQKLPALDEPPRMPGWICGIARNLARNAARKQREVAVLDDRDDSVAASDAGPLDSLLTTEARTLAAQALATLSDDDREAIALYYMGESGHSDVAHALGITEANARQRVHRARTKLRDAASAVEAVLRAARPGPAFTVGCVAALAAGKTVDARAATSTTTGASFAKPAALVGGAVAIVGAGIALLVASTRPSAERATPPASVATAPAQSSGFGSGRVAIDRAALLHRISPTTRAELVARLEKLERSSVAAPSPPPSAGEEVRTKVYDFSGGPLDGVAPVDPPPQTASPKRMLRYAIQELQPLLAECHAGLPSSGTLAMHLVLHGGPGVGTIVESVDIDPADPDDPPTAFESSFTDCMRETLYAIELPAMATHDRWEVHYPFVVTASK